MVSLFEKPSVRYGVALSTSAILVIIALGFLDGTVRWLILGLAIIEIVLFPQLMRLAV